MRKCGLFTLPTRQKRGRKRNRTLPLRKQKNSAGKNSHKYIRGIAMRMLVLIFSALLGNLETSTATDPPVGAAAVEALLKACSDAGVIVSEIDPKTGKV